MKRALVSVAAAGVIMLGAVDALAADVAVIVNKANPAEAISLNTLKQIMLSQEQPGTRSQLATRSWPDGTKIKLVLLSPGAPERTAAVKAIAGMTETDYTRHFMDAIFGGQKVEAPTAAKSPAEVKQKVAAAPGAVGLIPVSEVDDTVKVVKINGLAPGQAGYPIQ